MNSRTLLACVLIVVTVVSVFAGRKGRKNRPPGPPGGGGGGGDPIPPKSPSYDKGKKSEGQSDIAPEPAPSGIGALHSGCFVMYTLTSKGPIYGTDALFSFKFYRWMGWYWQNSPWYPTNNPGDDRESEHWDLYQPFPQGNGGLPADWIYVRQTSNFGDLWKIHNIFMKDVCHKKLYEYFCNDCWVSNNQFGGTWIKRTI